jgi:uncharacterized protein YraI
LISAARAIYSRRRAQSGGIMIRPLAVLGLLLASSAALASPAETMRDTWMYQGPSTHSPAVQEIPARAAIDVQSCGQTWCYGSWRNEPGFVRARALAFGAGGVPYGAPPPPPPGPIYHTWGWSYGVGVGAPWW